uniref:Uncharacterized protein n=1 Tax=Romanomermis culicivorax TaxID=13658 RepID=A0A915JFK7_ROMCU
MKTIRADCSTMWKLKISRKISTERKNLFTNDAAVLSELRPFDRNTLKNLKRNKLTSEDLERLHIEPTS